MPSRASQATLPNSQLETGHLPKKKKVCIHWKTFLLDLPKLGILATNYLGVVVPNFCLTLEILYSHGRVHFKDSVNTQWPPRWGEARLPNAGHRRYQPTADIPPRAAVSEGQHQSSRSPLVSSTQILTPGRLKPCPMGCETALLAHLPSKGRRSNTSNLLA